AQLQWEKKEFGSEFATARADLVAQAMSAGKATLFVDRALKAMTDLGYRVPVNEGDRVRARMEGIRGADLIWDIAMLADAYSAKGLKKEDADKDSTAAALILRADRLADIAGIQLERPHTRLLNAATLLLTNPRVLAHAH